MCGQPDEQNNIIFLMYIKLSNLRQKKNIIIFLLYNPLT